MITKEEFVLDDIYDNYDGYRFTIKETVAEITDTKRSNINAIS